MSRSEQFPLEASARLAGPVPEDALEIIAAEARAHGDHVETAAQDRLVIGTSPIVLQIWTSKIGLEASLTAPGERQLHKLRDGFLHYLDHVAPDLSDRIHWSGHMPSGVYPPNFRLARVVRVLPHGASYSRVRLAIEDMREFVGDGLHFRIWLPNPDQVPAWPHLSITGRTIWPRGEAAMHNPVYTLSDEDAAAGTVDIDIFRHDGGRMTQWADTVAPDAIVGMTGPGGGGYPAGNWLLMAGDETALPAIRRILHTSAADRCGVVLIEVGSAADIEALPVPAGMTLRWLIRGCDTPLADAVLAVPLSPEGDSRFVWVATEKSQVQALRRHFRDHLGLTTLESYLSGYWVR